jgi:hypothetical protein
VFSVKSDQKNAVRAKMKKIGAKEIVAEQGEHFSFRCSRKVSIISNYTSFLAVF